ncbi:hypothetical protein Daura_06220 [Dactylosporangium aurantiacum]|uniref:Uncharacterized protein n=1 Tax=Dactylosporangium aurantiacum TaxID=35754 RepID=A0A9Q9MIF1_9ACTN|nr:hypothetical protein Daura_06220 [Dactylosporangium aurantiacum]
MRDPAVQRANFGREFTGRDDELPGYAVTMLEITDPDVVALSGETRRPMVVRTGDSTDRVPGVVFEVTDDELTAADGYEVDYCGTGGAGQHREPPGPGVARPVAAVDRAPGNDGEHPRCRCRRPCTPRHGRAAHRPAGW